VLEWLCMAGVTFWLTLLLWWWSPGDGDEKDDEEDSLPLCASSLMVMVVMEGLSRVEASVLPIVAAAGRVLAMTVSCMAAMVRRCRLC